MTADFASVVSAERRSTLQLLADLDSDLAGMIAASESTNADDEHDPEGATIAFERAQVVGLITEARARLADLDVAVERISDGSYQTCEVCGRPIGQARLSARPATRECVACAGRRR
jgi:DnaK suppressor protein